MDHRPAFNGLEKTLIATAIATYITPIVDETYHFISSAPKLHNDNAILVLAAFGTVGYIYSLIHSARRRRRESAADKINPYRIKQSLPQNQQ